MPYSCEGPAERVEGTKKWGAKFKFSQFSATSKLISTKFHTNTGVQFKWLNDRRKRFSFIYFRRTNLLILCNYFKIHLIIRNTLSRTVFEIFDFKVVMVWPWPLEINWGQKYFHHSKAPCMTSYLTSIDIFSQSRTVFKIFDFKVFRIWPWPLEVNWGQKYFHHSKAHTRLPI